MNLVSHVLNKSWEYNGHCNTHRVLTEEIKSYRHPTSPTVQKSVTPSNKKYKYDVTYILFFDTLWLYLWVNSLNRCTYVWIYTLPLCVASILTIKITQNYCITCLESTHKSILSSCALPIVLEWSAFSHNIRLPRPCGGEGGLLKERKG
jgi:hypothetical protein